MALFSRKHINIQFGHDKNVGAADSMIIEINKAIKAYGISSRKCPNIILSYDVKGYIVIECSEVDGFIWRYKK